VQMVEPYFKIYGVIPTDRHGTYLVNNCFSNFPANIPTLSHLLDRYKHSPKFPELLSEKKLCIPIYKSYHIKGMGTVAVGRVLSGKFSIGNRIKISHLKGSDSIIDSENQKSGFESSRIEHHHKKLASTAPCDFGGINIRNIPVRVLARGSFLGSSLWPVISWVEANIEVVATKGKVRRGGMPTLYGYCNRAVCKVIKVKGKNGDVLYKGDSGVVCISLRTPLVLDKYSTFPQIGRFMLSDHKRVIAIGTVTEAIHKQDYPALIDMWPKLHFLLDLSCQDVIEAILCVFRRRRGTLNIPFDLVPILAQAIIRRWIVDNGKGKEYLENLSKK